MINYFDQVSECIRDTFYIRSVLCALFMIVMLWAVVNEFILALVSQDLCDWHACVSILLIFNFVLSLPISTRTGSDKHAYMHTCTHITGNVSLFLLSLHSFRGLFVFLDFVLVFLDLKMQIYFCIIEFMCCMLS